MARLSPAQKYMLLRLLRSEERCPFVGGRKAGRIASAWYRTAESLERKGYARRRATGDTYTASITEAGRQTIAGDEPGKE